MSLDQVQKKYPGIFLSGTDYDLPDQIRINFDKYSDFKELGKGGVGIIYSCYDQYLGRRVVMKRLPRELAENSSERRRFLREARITAQLQHPNTVPVYEVGRDPDGLLYFTMKKIEGNNLFRIISGIAHESDEIRQAFPLKTLLGILHQTCLSLHYAHTHGVVHRDIKPENIMVGLFGEVIVMDWGVAKVWGQRDDESGLGGHIYQRLTSSGQRPGTPLYMSPEQVRNTIPVDERTDIFSMGVVLYETLAQREPFRGQSINDTFDNILHENPRPPSEIASYFSISPELDQICMKALEKDPKNRFESIFEMSELLRQNAEQMAE
jgi:serine/threonine protein kinase